MGSSQCQHQPWEAATVAVVEDQPLAEESSQCQLWEVQVVLVVEVEELAEQEDSSRSLDIARKVEGIEDEVEDEVGGAAAAAGMDRRAVGGVGRKGMSMGVAAKAAVGSARRHAPWTAVCLEREEPD